MYNSKFINGDRAIKPYYYMRNGVLHVRYTVDRAVKLSESEEQEIKKQISFEPFDKQRILARKWNFLTEYVGKAVLCDGVQVGAEVTKELSLKFNKGDKNEEGNY